MSELEFNYTTLTEDIDKDAKNIINDEITIDQVLEKYDGQLGDILFYIIAYHLKEDGKGITEMEEIFGYSISEEEFEDMADAGRQELNGYDED